MIKRCCLSLLITLCLFSGVISFAQSDDDRVQEYISRISEDNSIIYFDLFGMDEGDTLYLYAESYDFDPLIGVCDIDCEDVYIRNDDIDYPKNTNSALEYTFEDDGDYSVFIIDCCDDEAEGIFRILLGLETDVTDGDVTPTGEPFAVTYAPTWVDLTETEFERNATQVQQFYGSIDEDEPSVYYDIVGEEGETLYLYAESDDFDTALVICGDNCDEVLAFNDDISDNNRNSALQYTFEDDGEYTIIVADCCDDEEDGIFRLLLGYNERGVLTNSVLPNGAQIATEFQLRRGVVAAEIDRDIVLSTDCSGIELGERPDLSGSMRSESTDNFVIHYTLSGNDETTEDFVEEVLDFVEHVLEVQIQDLGWPAPPRDCGEGGDNRYDFYLMEILDEDGILGYAQPEQVVGDNPASEELEEQWAAYGYMVLDNDYDGVPAPLIVMRATVAHEFHHLVQFGYDVGDEINWYYEATASWIETKTSDEQDVTDYTLAVFREPHLCIGTREDETGLRIYGEWLLIDSIAQDFGNDAIIDLWEIIAVEEGMDVFYEFLDELDTSPEDILRRYAIRNLVRDYDLGDEFPDTVDIVETIEDFETLDSGRDGIEELGMQYLFIRDSDTYTFEIDDNDLSMVVVGINPDDDEIDVYDIGQEGTVDTDPYDYAYLIILNTDLHDDPNDCRETDWELSVEDGSRDREDRPTDETFDVSEFEPAS